MGPGGVAMRTRSTRQRHVAAGSTVTEYGSTSREACLTGLPVLAARASTHAGQETSRNTSSRAELKTADETPDGTAGTAPNRTPLRPPGTMGVARPAQVRVRQAD